MNFNDNHLLKALVDTAPIGICILNSDGFIAELANEKFLQIAGRREEDLIGKSYWETFSEVREQFEDILCHVVSNNKAYHADQVPMILIRNDKQEPIYVTFVYAPMVDLDGKVHKVAIWVQENTKEVMEREKDTALNTAMKIDRDRLHDYFLQAPVGISVMTGENLLIEFVNPNYQAMLPGRSLVGRPFFESLPEIVDTDIAQALTDVFKTGLPVSFRDRLVAISKEEDGPTTDRYFDFSYVPRFDSNGQVDGVFNFAFEVTAFVHSRRKAQQESNNMLQILDMLPASVVVIRGFDLVVEMINDSNLAYWKKTREEVVGKPFLEILPDLADQPFASQLRQVMETGQVIDVKESPVIFTNADGSIRETYVDYTYQPLSDLDGNRNGVLVMSFEITDRVHARKLLEQYANELTATNELLAQSESRFKFLIQEAPVAIGVLQGKTLIVETANDKILEVWGKTREIVGLPLASALPELDGQPFLEILDNVFATKEPFYANEIPALLEHGGKLKQLFFNVVYQPIFDQHDNVSDIVIVAVDVTEQVNSRKSLEISEQHFRKLSDLVPVKISNALPNGEVTFFNQGWLDFSGLSFEDLRDFGYFQMIHPDEIENFQQGLLQASKTGVPFISEMRFKNKDGQYIWHINVASPVLDAQGELIMWVGSTTDIQSIKEEEQRKNDFIGMVSHELKTPLTSLNGYLQILQLKLKQDDGLAFAEHALERSLKQVRLMTSLTNGFLNVSRLESGKMHIEKSTFDLRGLFKETCDEYRILFPNNKITAKLSDEEIPIYADRQKIAQVFNNLIGNAVKYSPAASDIWVTVEQIGTRARVMVSDQGIGIKQEDLSRLFERYYRVGNTTVSGFGIGLYLSMEIIERHGGKIWAESELGKGSTFFFELDIYQN